MRDKTPEFESIHATFRPRILRYLIRLVGEREAEDLTQAVMLKVSRSLPKFRGDSSLATWIYRIATNSALDKLRGPTAEPPVLDDDSEERNVPLDARTPSLEATAIRAEMDACIREFIERLPEASKTVMVLSELEGFRNAEVAAILGVSLNAVKIRLHRAREKLRKELAAGCDLYRDERNELACDRLPVVAFPPARRA